MVELGYDVQAKRQRGPGILRVKKLQFGTFGQTWVESSNKLQFPV